jgi:predicted nucleic acid-binding protein
LAGTREGRIALLRSFQTTLELLIADAPPYSTELYSTSLNAGQEKGVCQQFMTEVHYVGVFRRRHPHANARPVFRARIEIIVDYLSWQVVLNDGASILEALEIEQRYQISFWDALIIQAAQASGVEVLICLRLLSTHHLQASGSLARSGLWRKKLEQKWLIPSASVLQLSEHFAQD